MKARKCSADFTIDAGSYAEAVKIAEGCPHMDFGSIEVREVDVIPPRK